MEERLCGSDKSNVTIQIHKRLRLETWGFRGCRQTSPNSEAPVATVATSVEACPGVICDLPIPVNILPGVIMLQPVRKTEV